MTSFVDTHCHGIPAVDDGVQNDESALILLKQAVESQIRLVFMTPHVIKDGKYYPSKAHLEKKLMALRHLISENQLPIEVKLGCEIMLTRESFKTIQDKDYWGYQDTDYVLIEFMPPLEENLIQDALYELFHQGKKVIIAHPERYFSDPQEALIRVKAWIKAGALMQVNKTSLFAASKASTRKVALLLLEKNLVSLIATDAHHAPGRRECRLKEAHTALITLFDQETADILCSINPTLLSENKPLLKTSVSLGLIVHLLRQYRFRRALKTL